MNGNPAAGTCGGAGKEVNRQHAWNGFSGAKVKCTDLSISQYVLTSNLSQRPNNLAAGHKGSTPTGSSFLIKGRNAFTAVSFPVGT